MLTDQEKKDLAKNFAEDVVRAVCEDLDYLPESWDGIDIRLYLADAFAWEAKGFKGRRRRHNREHIEAGNRSPLHY